MAKASKKKSAATKILGPVEDRIVEISLQHPDYGSRRLLPLLKQEKISVSPTTVYNILKRNGLQTREKRLAKIKEQTEEPKPSPKKPPAQITDEVAERIVQISLQNPDYGARRLVPLLEQEGILVSASTVYTILKRNGLQNRSMRRLELKEQHVAETPHPQPVAIPPPADKLQRFAEETLRRGMEQPNVNSPRGVAIVMNPQTGEILAMVSLPTYDNNLFTQGISALDWDRLANNPHRPLLNHAISDLLPPGSTFKIVVAAGALQEGVLTSDTRLRCPGKIIIPNKYSPNDPGRAQPFYCWNLSGHGWLDVVGGIAHSCDVFFYKTGGGFEETEFDGLGVERIARYARLFGLGELTQVELPAEVGGLVPTADWKRLTYSESWSTGDTYNLSIGQGFLTVTPLQMLNAANVVATGGKLVRPRVVHHVTDAEGSVTLPFEPEIVRTLPISVENWSLIRQGMEGAVAHGTSYRTQIEGLRIAGKTGTAQFCDDIMCGVGFQQPEHAWFLAYASREGADEPEVSAIVFLYNGGEGSVVAVPIVHDILEHFFGLDQVDEGDEATP